GGGGVHLHVIFLGNHAMAERLEASKQFGDVIHVGPVNDAEGLVRGYLAKERTSQADHGRKHVFGGRRNGSHRLPGGGDRIRLSRQLERDAVEAGDVRPWQHTNAKRKTHSSPGSGKRERHSPSGGRK